MRHSLLIVAALVLIGSSATAGDYIRIGVDSIPAGATNFEIPFYIERTCPSPTRIVGISNGIVMAATGDATWMFVECGKDSVVSRWFSMGGLLTSNRIDGIPPDSFLIGAAGFPGIPTFVERPFFSLFLDIGPGEGAINIDSSFVFPSGHWQWSNLTCGQEGAQNRPLFVDKYGSDANHPIHITVYKPLCGDANLDGLIDVDDPVFLLNYIFSSGPAPNPLLRSDCECSGGDIPVDIDDVVHLTNYIFRDGPKPCDVDGDGVPDC